MKVLFVRVKKATDFVSVPHLGLGILTSILEEHGHDVTVFDQLLFVKGRGKMPDLNTVIRDFKPDVIGFSVYNATYYESMSAVRLASSFGVPIILGGPYASIYPELCEIENQWIDYIVCKEAERVVVDLVENACIQDTGVIVVEGEPADLDTIPIPDFTRFLNWENIREYPLSTSRGCPFGCSFCAVKHIVPKGWRSRSVEACLDEIEQAVFRYPRLDAVKVVDDCPTFNPERFKAFLAGFAERGFDLEMRIDNIRADAIDKEMVSLAKRANTKTICIGVEHGNETVFNAIGKSESLDEIRRAACLIKNGGLKLNTCFIIGLPYDSLERTSDSIRLAKELEADSVIWNLAHPMEKTKMLDLFREQGAKIGDIRGYSSWEFGTLKLKEPVVETKDFTGEERKKAYFTAAVETGQYATNAILRDFMYLILYSIRYRYPRGITVGIPRFFKIVGGYVVGTDRTTREKVRLALDKARRIAIRFRP